MSLQHPSRGFCAGLSERQGKSVNIKVISAEVLKKDDRVKMLKSGKRRLKTG